jgi:hypothetical protein
MAGVGPGGEYRFSADQREFRLLFKENIHFKSKT